jgi:hypothetical protein
MPTIRSVPTAARGATHDVTLSPARRRLVDLMTDVQFGRIHSLIVRSGEPVFDPPPVVFRTLKFAATGNPRPPVGDPTARPAVTELLAQLTRLGNGVVHKIQVADGLPLLAEIEEQPHV